MLRVMSENGEIPELTLKFPQTGGDWLVIQPLKVFLNLACSGGSGHDTITPV
jgi:hypothetical protein